LFPSRQCVTGQDGFVRVACVFVDDWLL